MTGCGKYRIVWPTQALVEQGYDVQIILPKERDEFLEVRTFAGAIKDVIIPPDADVIVLQRVTHNLISEAIPLIQAKGVAVVMDVDDDLNKLHDRHPAKMAFESRNDHDWRNTVAVAHLVDRVVLSADALVPIYAPHGRVSVLKNCVPEWYLDVPRQDSDVIGWGGSVHSHPTDLQVMGNSIQRLTDEGLTFRVVGPGDDVKRILRLKNEPHITGPVEMDEAWPWMLSSLGVGVAPLADSPFNRSKSWLKPLEMAAVGVPCVMSPRIEYSSIMEQGIGTVAHKGKDWYDNLRHLADSPSLRQEFSERGREVARKWTIEANAWRWMEAWEEALKFVRR
jgi:glycosyltransferase involved in cell wall biosynthesis